MVAGQRALQEVEGGLGGRDAGAQRLRLGAQQVPARAWIAEQRERAAADRLFLALPMFLASATAPRR
ncbi:hypothetical protein ACFVFS_36825 [Kitasatospora sp. NPDC057692]|uniref:hypothetical protein n=1 Tax=Kitasatospora sp. NPDC057692 TaxID=3346215 RepID=UPI0036B32E5D